MTAIALAKLRAVGMELLKMNEENFCETQFKANEEESRLTIDV